jgi:serine O-acetyltransferase
MSDANGRRDASGGSVPADSHGVLALIMADYRAFADLRSDGPLRSWALMVARMLLNPSLHAVVLVRLSNASPRWMHWFWRNVLIWKHSMDVVYRPVIGPGLLLPHPFGIAIGKNVRIGRKVTITHHVSIGANFGSLGAPVIGDGALICANSKIFGDIEIGAGSIVGAGAFVDFDVPPGRVVGAPRAKLIESEAEELLKRAPQQL